MTCGMSKEHTGIIRHGLWMSIVELSDEPGMIGVNLKQQGRLGARGSAVVEEQQKDDRVGSFYVSLE